MEPNSQQYLEDFETSLRAASQSIGSVSGRLERLSDHKKNEFVLYPVGTGVSVACFFPEVLFEKIQGAHGKNVTVYGTVFHALDRPFPVKVCVETLEINPPDETLPSLAELRGIFKDANENATVDLV